MLQEFSFGKKVIRDLFHRDRNKGRGRRSRVQGEPLEPRRFLAADCPAFGPVPAPHAIGQTADAAPMLVECSTRVDSSSPSSYESFTTTSLESTDAIDSGKRVVTVALPEPVVDSLAATGGLETGTTGTKWQIVIDDANRFCAVRLLTDDPVRESSATLEIDGNEVAIAPDGLHAAGQTLAAGGLAPSNAAQIASGGNIVAIMVDDLNVDAFQAALDAGWLPNISNRLAAEGVFFQNSFVTNSACCPSRVTFLTGQYSHNHGVLSNRGPNRYQDGISWPGWFSTPTTPGREESTIATWLDNAGYRTGLIGKYLNGYGEVAPEGVPDPTVYIPSGWDDWQGLVGDTTYRVYDYTINDNGTLVTYGSSEADYQTDVIATRAADFINTALVQPGPFFLNITPLAPHNELSIAGDSWSDIRVAPRHAHLVDGDPLNGELPSRVDKPSFNELDVSDKPTCAIPTPTGPSGNYWTSPSCIAETPLLNNAKIQRIDQQYKNMVGSILAVDDLVGTVVDALEATNLLDSTTVMFTSDNGWLYGEHRQRGKLLAYEESIRVPLIIRSPGGAVGVDAAQIAINNDLAPTIAELAGVTPPYVPDGSSLVPILEDPAGAPWSRTMFLVEHFFVAGFNPGHPPTYFALRTIGSQDLLYVQTHANQQQLSEVTYREFYNHLTDPYQLRSIPQPATTYQSLDTYLDLLRRCKGDRCTQVEALF